MVPSFVKKKVDEELLEDMYKSSERKSLLIARAIDVPDVCKMWY